MEQSKTARIKITMDRQDNHMNRVKAKKSGKDHADGAITYSMVGLLIFILGCSNRCSIMLLLLLHWTVLLQLAKCSIECPGLTPWKSATK